MRRTMVVILMLFDILCVVSDYTNFSFTENVKPYLLPAILFFSLVALFLILFSFGTKKTSSVTNKGMPFHLSSVYFCTQNGKDSTYVGASVLEEMMQICIKERKEIRDYKIHITKKENQLFTKLILFPASDNTIPFEQISEELSTKIRELIYQLTAVSTKTISIRFESK